MIEEYDIQLLNNQIQVLKLTLTQLKRKKMIDLWSEVCLLD